MTWASRPVAFAAGGRSSVGLASGLAQDWESTWKTAPSQLTGSKAPEDLLSFSLAVLLAQDDGSAESRNRGAILHGTGSGQFNSQSLTNARLLRH